MSTPTQQTPFSAGYMLTLAAGMMISVGVAGIMLRPVGSSGASAPAAAVAKTAGAEKKSTSKKAPTKASNQRKPPLLERVSQLQVPGAEIVSYDPERKRCYVSCSAGVAMIQLAFDASPTLIRNVDVGAAAGFPKGVVGVATHVAVDPIGRGYAGVSVVPSAKARIPGAVVFIDLDSGEPLGSVQVGFNPDAVAFSPDGATLVVANEGEPELVRGIVVDQPGGVSLIDLSQMSSKSRLSMLNPTDVTPLGFHGGVVAAALARMQTGEQPPLRIHPSSKQTPDLDLEPESIAIDVQRAYVTLQENNGLAALDIASGAWTALRGLGPVERTMDASDKDGGVHIDDTVSSLPCADQIARFSVGGKTYLALCEEGDDRGDADESAPGPLADQARLAWLASQGRLAPTFMQGRDLSDAGLGRLHVCTFTGDSNTDGSLNHPVVLGTRSVGIYEAATLTRIGDTGSQIEETIARTAPTMFNASGDEPTKPDVRSDDRGPEPEGIAVATIGDRPVAFVTLERPGGIAVIDLKPPADPRVLGVVMTAAQGDLGPEGVAFIPSGTSPTTKPLLIVGFEQSGTFAIFRVNFDE